MKHSHIQNDEEMKLVETIHKMSNQINFSEQNGSAEHSQFLIEVIESLEAQLEAIRKNRQVSSLA